MATTVPFLDFRNFTGINNVKDKFSLHLNELSEATNVDLDDAGVVVRREGQVKKQSGEFKSVFATDYMLIAVKDGDLVRVSDDLTSSTVLRADVGDMKMSYVEVNDNVYYTNGQAIGYIENLESKEFTAPDTEGRIRTPAGHLIEYFHGRLYVAKGNIVYYTDPMNFAQVRKRKGFIQLDKYITLMKAVDGGMFISDGNIKFLSGSSPENFVVHIMANYNAIKGEIIDGSFLGGETPIAGKVLYMLTEKGFCVGLSDGQFFNLTKDRYTNITATGASGVHRVVNGISQFVTITEN